MSYYIKYMKVFFHCLIRITSKEKHLIQESIEILGDYSDYRIEKKYNDYIKIIKTNNGYKTEGIRKYIKCTCGYLED